MSWLNLNQSLSGLKGQFKNLANEVFSEGIVEDTDPFTEVSAANDKIKELQSFAASQDAEVSDCSILNQMTSCFFITFKVICHVFTIEVMICLDLVELTYDLCKC